MTFFGDSSDVRISGGEFNIVHGNLTNVNQRRYTTNTGTYNNTSVQYISSRNDNSQHNYGRLPYQIGVDRPSPRWNGARPDVPLYNGSVFPPSQVHPALLGGQSYLPPGSIVDNHNSLNTTQTSVMGQFNDNTKAHNVPLTDFPLAKNPGVGPLAELHSPYAQPSNKNQHGNFPSTNTSHSDRTTPSPTPPRPRWGIYPEGRSSPSAYTYYQNTWSSGALSGRSITVSGNGFSAQNIAIFKPGDIQMMTPDVAEAFKAKLATLTPSHIDNEDFSDEEDQTNDPEAAHAGGGYDSPVDASTDPTFSAVESNPALTPSMPQSNWDAIPRNTLPLVSQHVKTGYHTPPSNLYSTSPGIYHSQIPTQPSASDPDPLLQFGLHNKKNRVNGQINFNTYKGHVQKYDQRSQVTNINSGNTYNHLVVDSYNDNSVQSSAVPDTPPESPSMHYETPENSYFSS